MKKNAIVNPNPYPQQVQHLTNEEFESLKRVVQLLRISQLRYIVQKFSIPASGNKTKLLGLLLSIFQSLRYEKVLIDIYNEINNMLSKKETNSIKQLEIFSQFDPNFKSPPNPLQSQSEPPFMLGPIFVPPGQSSGKFGFMCSDPNEELNKLINISFLFPGGKAQQFAFKGDINGFPFEVSIDDPYPQPIDITDFININTLINTLKITMIRTSSPMMICIREYKFNGIQNIMNQVMGRTINIDEEDFDVFSNNCQHKDSFSLKSFLSQSLGTGNWNCPICGQQIDPFNLTVIGPCNQNKEIRKGCFSLSSLDQSGTSYQLSLIASPSEAQNSIVSPFLSAPNGNTSINTISQQLDLQQSTSHNIEINSKSDNTINNQNYTTNAENICLNNESPLPQDRIQNTPKKELNDCEANTVNNMNNTNDLFKITDTMTSFDWDR